MAISDFNKISYEGNLYYPRDTRGYLVKGTQSSSTNLWTGVIPEGVTEYYDGLTIDYYLPYAGTTTGATLNLSSSGTSLGAKPVYRGNSTSQVTTQYPRYSVIRLTYIIDSNLNSGNGCWKATAFYDSNAGGTVTNITAGTGLSVGTTAGGSITTTGTLNHTNSVTAGTAGTSSDTSGSTLAVPYVTYDSEGHVTESGSHTHTVTGFLTAHQTIKQDGVTGATGNHYVACSTAAGTAAKTGNILAGTFGLEVGSRVVVKFDNANTASTPTLNINSKGAKNIFHKGVQITTGNNKALLAGICEFVYDGTQWHLVGNYIGETYPIATNSTQGLIKPWYNHTAASTGPTAGSDSTAVAVNAKTSNSGRYYLLEMDSNGRGFTNVPWSNTNVTQNSNTSNVWRGLLSTYNSTSTSSGSITSGATNVSYYANGVGMNPSKGVIRAKDFYMELSYSGTPGSATGADADLVNRLYNLGWMNADGTGTVIA